MCVLGHILWLIAAVVSCDPLDNPNNGRVDTSAGTSFGDVARYSCNTGYTVSDQLREHARLMESGVGVYQLVKVRYILLECSALLCCML